jgi:hypothetical protein
MKTQTPTIAILLVATALLAMPGVALAGEYFVPSGNSAAAQYTAAFPAAGGETAATHRGKASSDQAIGARNAKRLRSRGPEGEAAAALAVQTDPEPVVPEPSAAPRPHRGEGRAARPEEAARRRSGGPSGKQTSTSHHREGVPAAATRGPTPTAGSGSSGPDEVAGKVLGLSSPGGLGFLLPFALIAALAWALLCATRQRKRQLG